MPTKYYDEKANARSQRYHEGHIKQVKFGLSIEHDADILAYLDSLPNKQGYIKALIRADIAAHQKKEETMQYTVDVAHFIEGNGYIFTETIETGATTEIFTAEEYISRREENGEELPVGFGEAIDVTVKIYAAGADPMFSDPISESTTTLTED